MKLTNDFTDCLNKKEVLNIIKQCKQQNLTVYFTKQGLLYYNDKVPLVYCDNLINPSNFKIHDYFYIINHIIQNTKDIKYLIDNNDYKEVYNQLYKYTLGYTPLNHIQSLFLDVFNYKEKYSNEMLSIFREIALDVRFSVAAPLQNFDNKIIKLLKESKPYKYSKMEQFNIPEKITVYRGESSKSTVNGLSWSTSKHIAELFANDFGNHPIIRQKRICKKDILAMYNSHYENECLIDLPNRKYNLESQKIWN